MTGRGSVISTLQSVTNLYITVTTIGKHDVNVKPVSRALLTISAPIIIFKDMRWHVWLSAHTHISMNIRTLLAIFLHEHGASLGWFEFLHTAVKILFHCRCPIKGCSIHWPAKLINYQDYRSIYRVHHFALMKVSAWSVIILVGLRPCYIFICITLHTLFI